MAPNRKADRDEETWCNHDEHAGGCVGGPPPPGSDRLGMTENESAEDAQRKHVEQDCDEPKGDKNAKGEAMIMTRA